MAVKKHKRDAENQKQFDLVALAKYFQLLNEQQNYLPQIQDVAKHCQDILKCLSRTAGTEEQLWQLLQPVEEFLVRMVSSVHHTIRYNILLAILDKFYTYISDPKIVVYPPTAVVLIAIECTDEEAIMSAARWTAKRTEEPNGSCHRVALSRLYDWITNWQGRTALGDWVLAYIKALEENKRFDLLIDASLEWVAGLFLSVGHLILLRRNYVACILHVLASLRESPEALDRISPHIEGVLVNLASESGRLSRELLQSLVDILTAMLSHIKNNTSSESLDNFRNKYSDVEVCLRRHISSGTSSFRPAWRREANSGGSSQPASVAAPPKNKVGLLNLGNTCYMNSILQALFAARKFSIHLMMNLAEGAFSSEVGDLFAKMMFSESPSVTPINLQRLVISPDFSMNQQHDSSEFLGYLFNGLRSGEANLESGVHNNNRSQSGSSDGDQHSLRGGTPENWGNSPSRRLQQSTAGGANAGLASGSRKRQCENDPGPARKRGRINGQSRRNTIVEDMFGGSLLSRVECNHCNSYSVSRDMFCELQLSFPEKLMDKTHSVQSLLEYYCSVERLSGENRYLCGDCNELRDADRSVRIDKSPIHLILVLKNFKYDAKNDVHTKLMHTVLCNLNIVLPTVRSSKKGAYNLFAAVIHSGINIDSGHYYTIAKDEDGWYRYDDSVVTVFDETFLNDLDYSCTPYILFYKRSDVDDVRLPTLNELPQQRQNLVLTLNKMYKNKG